MPQVLCKKCQKKFYAKPSWIKNGAGKYCSSQCRQDAQKNGKYFRCHICQKSIYRSKKEQRNSKSKKYFCSKTCQTIWRNSEVKVGSNHPNWNTGEASYRNRLQRSGEKQECKRCKIDDRRILSVHHIDKNRSNNELSNLIFMCHNCHFLIHKYPEESGEFIKVQN